MGESRTELLAWLNALLQLTYTKVEQAGTGAAYCQIMDSIFRDVNMSKVKFDTKHEYEYISNFKILQHTFDKHKIDKIIPVDKLIKCKFQDNLEFMQWLKKYWEEYYPGGDYDNPSQRRKGKGSQNGSPVATRAAPAVGMSSTKRTKPAAGGGGASAVSKYKPTSGFAKGTRRVASPLSNGSSAGTTDPGSNLQLKSLKKELNDLQAMMDGLERERDFYFNKLREIEIIVQEQVEVHPALSGEDGGCLGEIQNILYRTEEGFEAPVEQINNGGEHDGLGYHNDHYDDELETF